MGEPVDLSNPERGSAWRTRSGEVVTFYETQECACEPPCMAFKTSGGGYTDYRPTGRRRADEDDDNTASPCDIIGCVPFEVEPKGDVITERFFADRLAACKAASVPVKDKPVQTYSYFRETVTESRHEQKLAIVNYGRGAIAGVVDTQLKSLHNDKAAAVQFLSDVRADMAALEKKYLLSKPTRRQLIDAAFGSNQ